MLRGEGKGESDEGFIGGKDDREEGGKKGRE